MSGRAESADIYLTGNGRISATYVSAAFAEKEPDGQDCQWNEASMQGGETPTWRGRLLGPVGALTLRETLMLLALIG